MMWFLSAYSDAFIRIWRLISSVGGQGSLYGREIHQPAVTGIGVALLSGRRWRSAEEYVSEDWPAVAQAIGNRMAELGISQRELIERSHLSKAVVREVQHNV